MRLKRLSLRCFNPYFTGSNSGSVKNLLFAIAFNLVSILILLEVILEALLPNPTATN